MEKKLIQIIAILFILPVILLILYSAYKSDQFTLPRVFNITPLMVVIWQVQT